MMSRYQLATSNIGVLMHHHSLALDVHCRREISASLFEEDLEGAAIYRDSVLSFETLMNSSCYYLSGRLWIQETV